jgi:Zn-dependent M28 family amino/carboxypeptidase
VRLKSTQSAVRFLRLGLAALCLVVCSSCAPARRAPPPSAEVQEEGFRDAVRVLASDEFEGRRPGTSAQDKTVEFIVARFRKLGLKPAVGDSYLQPVPMVELVPGADALLRMSAGSSSRSLAYAAEMVIWSPRVLPEVSLARSGVLFLGYGIAAPEYGWNDYADVDVRGRTVIVLSNDPGHVESAARLFKGRAETFYGTSEYKFAEAARRGAAAVLIVHDPDGSGFEWSAVVNQRTGPQLLLANADDGASQPAIEGWLSGAAARALFAQSGADFAGLAAAAAEPGFKAVDLHLTADAQLHQSIRRFNSANVIGLLPGSRRRTEYLVYSAHWDSLGRIDTALGPKIFHGAVDDASGVAGLLELAQSFRRTRPEPERSILFMAFTGAAAEPLGSEYYVANPLFPLSNTVADLNLDALHIGGPTRDVSVIGFGQSELEGTLRDLAALQGRELHVEPNPELGLYYRSDDFSFAKAGVPALYAVGGVDDAARGPRFGGAQLEDFWRHRYADPSDAYSPDWDVRGTLEDLTLYYRLGLRLAQSHRFPNWYSASEFRAARERSREGSTD